VTRRAPIGLWFALVAVLAFLLFPILAVVTAVGPAELVDALGRDVVRDALLVSVRTSLIAQVLVVGVGTPAAYLIARGVPLRALMLALVELPLVLPPAVAGLGLLYAFGADGVVGGALADLGLRIPLTQTAVVLAVAYVSGPFYIRAAVAAFGGVDRAAVDAARTLGATPARVFARVVVPLARPGLVAGLTLSVARGLGEFGATIVVAGSLQGVTQTLPLAVYAELDGDPVAALAIGSVLIAASLVILVASKLVPAWRR
jgi:molybdate transport system permease protein